MFSLGRKRPVDDGIVAKKVLDLNLHLIYLQRLSESIQIVLQFQDDLDFFTES